MQHLFDHKQRLMQRERNQSHQSKHDFLYHRAAEDIEMRLYGITRDFPTTINLNAQNGIIEKVLTQASNIGKIINVDSLSPLPKTDEKAKEQTNNFILCSDESLPFEPHSADLIVSVLNLHYINDLPGYLRQIRTILKPDGLFLGALCGGNTLSELRTVLMQAEEEISGGVSPRVIPFANIKDMGALLQQAGFAMPVADLDRFTVQYDTMFHLMKELKGMGAANILQERQKSFAPRQLFMRAAQLYQEQFSNGDKINVSCEIIHLTAWSPSPDQPKPLKPGSAKTSMAQAVFDKKITKPPA